MGYAPSSNLGNKKKRIERYGGTSDDSIGGGNPVPVEMGNHFLDESNNILTDVGGNQLEDNE